MKKMMAGAAASRPTQDTPSRLLLAAGNRPILDVPPWNFLRTGRPMRTLREVKTLYAV